MLMSLATTVRVKQDSDANGFGVGVMTATQAGAVGYVVEDGDVTMKSLSFVDASAVRLNSNTSTMSHEATVLGDDGQHASASTTRWPPVRPANGCWWAGGRR